MDSWLMMQYAEIEAIKAEIEAMKALNVYCQMRDETIAYDEGAFLEKANEIRAIANGINNTR